MVDLPFKGKNMGEQLVVEEVTSNLKAQISDYQRRYHMATEIAKALKGFEGKVVTKRLVNHLETNLSHLFSFYYSVPDKKFGVFGDYKLTVYERGKGFGSDNGREEFRLCRAENAVYSDAHFHEANSGYFNMDTWAQELRDVLPEVPALVAAYNSAAGVMHGAILGLRRFSSSCFTGGRSTF